MPDTHQATIPVLERVVLVAVKLKTQLRSDVEDSLEELGQLAETAGLEVLCTIVQPRETPDPAFFIGEGKIAELGALISEAGADAVVFDNELTPAQTRNIEKTLDTVAIDRTSLILDIFAQRAQTKEAKLQVELAQLEYALPRLTRLWTHLSRLATGGGGSSAVGAGRTGGAVRGPGETQLQIDRNLIRAQVMRRKKALKTVEKQRRVQRSSRSEMIKVSLVGYTNAGKSTLFNALTGENRLAEDRLFATLDPTTRVVDLPDNRQFLLTDTVGFIKKLPHHLVAAFKATLEEVAEADLLLHVVDGSHPQAETQIEAVNSVLKSLNAHDISTVVLLNKMDLFENEEQSQLLRIKYPDSLEISARTGAGLDQLKIGLAERFASHDLDMSLILSYRDGKALDYLYKHGEVFEADYGGNAIQVKARLPHRYLKALDPLVAHSTYVLR